VPCGVSVIGIDKNAYTGNTRNLGISPDDRIIAIDGVNVVSLQEVRDYMNSLDVTKEVTVETVNKTYLVKTYQIDGKRYMGLLLKEEVCAARDYN
jgi:PDZ domain-containing secreted protein